MRRHVVVVGNGMAGSRLVQELVTGHPDRRPRVTVLDAERDGAYNRVLLSRVLAGQARPDDIMLAGPQWYAEHGVEVRSGVAAVAVDRDARTVLTADGTRIGYDDLVLATGSTAVVPPIPGLRDDRGGLCAGAAVFRTLQDCDRLVELAGRSSRAVVLGGGLLGLEAARGLAGRGLPVTVVHDQRQLMDRQLDEPAGAALARTLAALGVAARTSARATAVLGDVDGSGRFAGLVLADGATVPGDLLVVACGVRPDTTLARGCGLAVDAGVLVDDRLTSLSDPAVHAIGECAQHAGQVYGLVAPAWEQARVLAGLLTGAEPQARYRGSRLVTRLKAAGVDLAAMGDTHADDDDAEVLRFADLSRGTYKKLVLRDDRVVGAILLGDIGTVGTVTQLFDRQAPVPGDRLSLLFTGLPAATGATAAEADAALVCRCNTVTRATIVRCWRDGARDVDALVRATCATTGCGGCRDTVEELATWLAEADPAPRREAVPA